MEIVIPPYPSEKIIDNVSVQSVIVDEIVSPDGIVWDRLDHFRAITHANQIKDGMDQEAGKKYLSAVRYRGTSA